MADISKIKVGSTTYNIKDATARSSISSIKTGTITKNKDIAAYGEESFTVTHNMGKVPRVWFETNNTAFTTQIYGSPTTTQFTGYVQNIFNGSKYLGFIYWLAITL